MALRYLTITLQPDWKGALRAMGQAAKAEDEYQGEVRSFESPGVRRCDLPVFERSHRRDLERFKMGHALAELGHQIGWQ